MYQVPASIAFWGQKAVYWGTPKPFLKLLLDKPNFFKLKLHFILLITKNSKLHIVARSNFKFAISPRKFSLHTAME